MDKEPLKIKDMEGVSEAVLTLVSKYPDMPKNRKVQWQSMDDGECIGLYTLSGAVYLKRYISGAFIGQMPFRIMYQVSPTTNKARINSQKFLEELAKWLETCSAEFRDPKLSIESIERTSPVIMAAAYEDGSEVYQTTMNITYIQKIIGG